VDPYTTGDDHLSLDDHILNLLADESYFGHPLHGALQDVMTLLESQLKRLESLTQISERSKPANGPNGRQLILSRYDHQISKLERSQKISDRYQAILNDLNKALHEASTHDQLTGLPNRRLMSDRCRSEDRRAQRLGTPYALLAIDVDRFKSINDTYGHEIGDQVLVAMADAFRRGLRGYDICARWGGEEFLALLGGTDLSMAVTVAERLLETVRCLSIEVSGATLHPRVSIGIAERRDGEEYSDVYRRADEALYSAKQAGRDCYMLADH